jgi:ribosome-associated heat shock protein Hsp15
MTELRIDKFLWFARFCKSRNLAQNWIEAGEVSLNGAVTLKCSAAVRIGDLIEMPRGPKLRHRVRVLALAERRGGAPEAQALYESVAITTV